MRSALLMLVTTVAFGNPVLADPLRDAASDYFAPLSESIAASDGKQTSPELLALGKILYFDPRYSATGQMSCMSCHDLNNGGQDGLVTPVMGDGSQGLRNTTSVYDHVLNESFFWDGRDMEVATQPDVPIKEGVIMLNDPDAAIAAILAIPGYADLYSAAFPGEADPINLNNTALALDAYVATLLTPSPFDAWLAGDDTALTSDQKEGLSAFLSRGCPFCHFGPALGGTGYYPLGLVELPGIDVLAVDEIAAKAASDPSLADYVFRTAPLRNVALTAPYFHSGKVADLATAVDVMAAGQLGSPLEPEETRLIVAFLESLSGAMPEVTPPTLP